MTKPLFVKNIDPHVVVIAGLVPKGTYNPATDYAVGDSVDYNGSSYVMFLNAGAGTLPTNTTYWQVLANKGATGTTGAEGLQWMGAWSAVTAYVIDDAVSLDGNSYICILGHTNHTPPNGTYWQLLAAKGDAGVSGDHGTLTGLGDDDHGQYHNDARGDVRYYLKATVDSLLGAKLATSLKGAANGLAELDSSGLVPAAQLPSYVDDVIEAANFAALPGTGATGKIYVTLDNNKTYRWSGSAYVEISASPGSTDSVTEGSVNLYFTEARVRAAILTGLSLATGTAITAADSILTAFGKIQKQITDNLATLTAHTSNTSNPHSTTAAQVGLGSVPNVDATNRGNHTGSQTASTISDFSAAVRAVTLTGISLATGTAIDASDTVLSALGKLQKQITDLTTVVSGKQATLVSGTNIKTINGASILGSGDLVVTGSGGISSAHALAKISVGL